MLVSLVQPSLWGHSFKKSRLRITASHWQTFTTKVLKLLISRVDEINEWPKAVVVEQLAISQTCKYKSSNSILIKRNCCICARLLPRPKAASTRRKIHVYLALNSVRVFIVQGRSRTKLGVWTIHKRVLRADEGETKLIWSSAGTQGQEKRHIPQKTRRPFSDMIPICENPRGDPAGVRARFAWVGGESSEPMMVIMERRRNERAGETGEPRENPPTNGFVWHDSHLRSYKRDTTLKDFTLAWFLIDNKLRIGLSRPTLYRLGFEPRTSCTPDQRRTNRLRHGRSTEMFEVTVNGLYSLDQNDGISRICFYARHYTLHLAELPLRNILAELLHVTFTRKTYLPRRRNTGPNKVVEIYRVHPRDLGRLLTAKYREPMRVIEVNMERRRNEKGQGKREVPEKTRRPTAWSGTTPICKNPVTRPWIEPDSPWWEASRLTAQPTWPLIISKLAPFTTGDVKCPPCIIGGAGGPAIVHNLVNVVPDGSGMRILAWTAPSDEQPLLIAR
ncbi:hypothetical protein PR048_029269 [Dryococelus australis]|uniref:Uncharacterized protein n=1 Tax=Dryococelus australis TaxID=614101 RepID=A0ABQ9GCY0_9NEOP|nr:hypothetical protein PR048_029269 [Dryococelus australis]